MGTRVDWATLEWLTITKEVTLQAIQFVQSTHKLSKCYQVTDRAENLGAVELSWLNDDTGAFDTCWACGFCILANQDVKSPRCFADKHPCGCHMLSSHKQYFLDEEFNKVLPSGLAVPWNWMPRQPKWHGKGRPRADALAVTSMPHDALSHDAGPPSAKRQRSSAPQRWATAHDAQPASGTWGAPQQQSVPLKLLEDMREVIRVCEANLDEMRGLTRDLAQALESQ